MSEFEAKHPRADAGRFTEKAQDDAGAQVLAEPGLDDVVTFEGPMSLHDKEQKVGRRVRELIENGRWAVRAYNELTGDVEVAPAGCGDLAHAIPHAVLGIRMLERDSHWTDYASGSHTYRVYRPVTEPLPRCENGCGRRMLPDDRDYWSAGADGTWYCDSTWCVDDDQDMYPRDEPTDAREAAVSPWWENH